MNTKHVIWGTLALVAASGAWVGRAAWRAHRNLVTLHVRNAPLAEVVGKIESQTREKISVDKKLDALITLDLKDKPLAVVLDRLAEQAGARWSTVYAVYESKAALGGLESALHGDRKMEEAGWKTIAPAGLAANEMDLQSLPEGVQRMISTNIAGPDGGGRVGPGPVRVVVTAGGPRGAGGGLSRQEDVQVRSGQAPRSMVVTTDDTADDAGTDGSGKGGMVKTRKTQATPVVRFIRSRAGGNGAVEEDIWSPEELVLESRLAPRLAGDFSAAATPEAADEAAHTVKGRWRTYYALRKSPMAFAGLPMMASKFKRGPMEPDGKALAGGGTNVTRLAGHGGGMDIEGAMRAQRYDELGKLTPEQRVQRARERQASKGVIQRISN